MNLKKIILFLFILFYAQINYAMEDYDLKYIRIKELQLKSIMSTTHHFDSLMNCEIKADSSYSYCMITLSKYYDNNADPSIKRFFNENKDNPKLKLNFFDKNNEKCPSITRGTNYEDLSVTVSAMIDTKCYPIYFTAATIKDDVEFLNCTNCADCIAMQVEIDTSNKQAISIKNISPNSNMLILCQVDILQQGKYIAKIKMQEAIEPNSSGFIIDLKNYLTSVDQEYQIVFHCADANFFEHGYDSTLVMRYIVKVESSMKFYQKFLPFYY
jgi:hypothetical protein